MGGLRMAPAARTLAACRARGVRLLAAGDRLRVEAPRGVLDDGLRSAIRAHRDALLAMVRDGGASPAPDSAFGAAKDSPAYRLELAWRKGLARARAGFREEGLDPLPGQVAACAVLETAVEEGRSLAAAPPDRLSELLRRAYAGDCWAQLRCEALAGRALVEALDAQAEGATAPASQTAEALLQECRQRGVRLWLSGTNLRTDPGPCHLPARLFERIVARQEELREALSAEGRA